MHSDQNLERMSNLNLTPRHMTAIQFKSPWGEWSKGGDIINFSPLQVRVQTESGTIPSTGIVRFEIAGCAVEAGYTVDMDSFNSENEVAQLSLQGLDPLIEAFMEILAQNQDGHPQACPVCKSPSRGGF